MASKSNIILVFFLTVAWINAGMAQRRPLLFTKPFVEDNQMEFKHYTSDDGLSNDRITDLLQDKNGCIWIATLNGLNKFDGLSFSIIKAESSTSSRQPAIFTSLAQTDEGEVYTGTENGLYKYNASSNLLQKISLLYDTSTYSDESIRDILFHRDTLWISTEHGLLIPYNVNTSSIDTCYHFYGTYQPYYHYHALYMDRDNNFWFGDRNSDPLYLNSSRKKITRYLSSRTNFAKKRESDVSGFLHDSKGRLWVSALDGVFFLNKESGVFKKFIRPSTWCMAQRVDGTIWFGTGMGLLQYDEDKNEIYRYSFQKDNFSSISSNNIYQILFDNADNIWLATDKGLDVYSSSRYPFHKFVHLAGIDNSPGGNSVSAVTESKNGNLWIGYDRSGMDYFDKENEQFTHFRHHSDDDNSIGGDKVADLYMDSGERLWVGLWQGIGFNIFNPKKGHFRLITFDKTSFNSDWYNDFMEADNGKMYVGFWGAKGLAEFDRRSLSFEKFFGANIFPKWCCRLITRLEKDNRQNIWFGTTNCGVYRVNTITYKTAAYAANDSSGLASDEINDILFSNGELWLLSSTLQKYSVEKNSFRSYGEKILSNYNLKAMLRDDDGNFWISTGSKGILVYNTDADSLIARYTRKDGLQSNKFNDARLKLSTGEFFFGGQNGFNLFDPATIKSKNTIPTIHFGKFWVADSVRYYQSAGLKRIILKPDENVFTIELLNNDMANPENYRYETMLRGYDKTWVTVSPKTRTIRYTGVPYGNYELLYRIANGRGLTTRIPVSLAISVDTPFYRTWLFYTIVFLVIVAIVGAFFKIRYDELKTKQHNLNLREQLFRLQVNPHFLFNALIAIQNYILNHKAKEAGMYLSNFARFFRIMLESSQSEAILLETEVEMLTLYLGLQQIRYPERFIYQFEIDENLPEDLTLIPAMMVQPILENAIEHAFIDKLKEGILTIRFKLEKKCIRFEAEDNGIGMKASKKIKKTAQSKNHQSSAISIIKERVAVLSKKYHYPEKFEIKEVAVAGEVSGTMVIMNLPIIKQK
ncbi:MAG: hypothetical protein DRJ09_05905 [Bacteroidetes bacterium]|nr:MAG: hypothetical protein DRJ09_05905 [Bacteroidota bacterium]